MPAGAVYQLIANEGKADQMIMAPDLLLMRIKQIRCQKEKLGLKDTLPTLADIERTHMIFVNSHFKPFAPIAFEYYKGTPSQGSNMLGGNIWFAIPQFGEFFNDAVVHLRLSSVTLAAGGVVPAAVAPTSGWNNNVLTVVTTRYVNNAGTELTPATACKNYVYYCDFPGARILPKSDFQVSNVSLDSYTQDKYVFYMKCNLSAEKKLAFYKCMGQEIPIDAYSHVGAVNGVDSSTDTARQVTRICNGYQTPKEAQPALDLWIPVLFWFCDDVRNSIASVTMPSASRHFIFDIADYDKLLFTTFGNLYKETTTLVLQGTPTNSAPFLSGSTTVTREPISSTGNPAITRPTIDKAEIYIGNIFVTPEIHEIYLNRIGFSLIRIHRYQSIPMTTNNYNVQLNNLTFPTEQVYFGLRPATNETDPKLWHKFTYDTARTYKMRTTSRNLISNTSGTVSDGAYLQTCNSEVERFTYYTQAKTITKSSIKVQGVPLYTETPSEFFNHYVPFHFGGNLISSPDDEGINLLNFAFYPRAGQPSSHLNLSRTREFYIEYWSDVLGSTIPNANFVALGIHLNFLMLSDGSATIRYIT